MYVLEKYEIILYYQSIFCDCMFHAMIHCEYLAITNIHLQSYFTLVRGFHCIAVKFLSIHQWWIGNGLFLFLKYHCIVTCNIYWAPTMYQVLSKCLLSQSHLLYAPPTGEGATVIMPKEMRVRGGEVTVQVGIKSVSSRAGIPGQVFLTLKSVLQPCHHAFLFGW